MRMIGITVCLGLALIILNSCSALNKNPFMCCASKTTVSCTTEIPVDGVASAQPGQFCAVSTDLLKAQTAAQSGVK